MFVARLAAMKEVSLKLGRSTDALNTWSTGKAQAME
jgi:hypothetical protein